MDKKMIVNEKEYEILLELLNRLDELHTTELGVVRIKQVEKRIEI